MNFFLKKIFFLIFFIDFIFIYENWFFIVVFFIELSKSNPLITDLLMSPSLKVPINFFYYLLQLLF